jgi:selenide,water dikinase
LVSPRRIISNAAARPGDLLVLTKPLGMGIITTGIKKGVVSRGLERKAMAMMRRLNTAGHELAQRGLVAAGTDVTGFGLLGHLGALCQVSGVSAEIYADQAPVVSEEVWDLIKRECIPGGTRLNLRHAEALAEWSGVSEAQRLLLADAQTSGGLLLCLAPRHWAKAQTVLRAHRTICRAVIGCITRQGKALLRVSSGK